MTPVGEVRGAAAGRRRVGTWPVGAAICIAAIVGVIAIIERRPPPPVTFCAGVGLSGPWRLTPEEAFDAWLRQPGGVPNTPRSGWTVDARSDDVVSFVPPPQPTRGPYQRVSVERDGGVWSVGGACV